MDNKEAVFRKVYQQVGDKLYRLCLGYTGQEDDAKDLMQEILILVWTHLEQFRQQSNIETWIFRIATNRALLYVKRKNRTTAVHTSMEAPAVVQAMQQIAEEDSSQLESKVQALYRAVATLNNIDRILVGLLLEGIAYQEMATITGLTLSNVGVRINRIKKTLSTLMQ